MGVVCAALYGALFYLRLGEGKAVLPEQPPPPPEPTFLPLQEVMGPWIKPTPYAPKPGGFVPTTKFDAALAASQQAAAAKTSEEAEAKAALAVPAKKPSGATKASAADGEAKKSAAPAAGGG